MWPCPPGVAPAAPGQGSKSFSDREPRISLHLSCIFQCSLKVSELYWPLSKGAVAPFLCENRNKTLCSQVDSLKICTFHVGDKAQTPLKVRADRVEAPSEFCITAILVGTAGVVADIQLVAALGHCWNAQVHLRKEKEENATFRPTTLGNLAHLRLASSQIPVQCSDQFRNTSDFRE